jgi:hypothetical protein
LTEFHCFDSYRKGFGSEGHMSLLIPNRHRRRSLISPSGLPTW